MAVLTLSWSFSAMVRHRQRKAFKNLNVSNEDQNTVSVTSRVTGLRYNV
ncbi:hypothetical protein Tsp_14471 [Trichinella spiralis]|nr:hypothetical protein Tsp_14471 [Trichinella spiralis]